MDDGNIAPENPSKQEPNQCNKRVETSQSNHKDVRWPTQMPETDNPTREKETSHRHIWRIVTQATYKSHHGRPGHISICPIEIRDSRKTPQRHMRSMWRKEERTDASRSTRTRPKPTVSPLIIPLLYCHINGFQRAFRVEKPLPGGEKKMDGWTAHPVAW